MKNLTFQQNEVVFKQGEFGNTMYEITSGKIGIYSEYGTENEKEITVLGAGELFGEMGMIDVLPRSATAVALEETAADELTPADFEEYFKDKPEKAFQLMKILGQRLRETTANYAETCKTAYDIVESELKKEEKTPELKEKMGFFAKIFRGLKKN